MKIKHTIFLMVLGLCCDFAGAVQKIMHTSYADKLLIAGAILKIAGLLLFFYKLTIDQDTKDFMNR